MVRSERHTHHEQRNYETPLGAPAVFAPVDVYVLVVAVQWCRNKHLNMLAWRDARVMCDDWVYFRPEDTKPDVIMDAMESFHHFFSWSTVPNTTMRLETFMGPDSDRRPPPHERTMKELRAFFPKPGDLERLFWLKRQVDPMSNKRRHGDDSRVSIVDVYLSKHGHISHQKQPISMNTQWK